MTKKSESERIAVLRELLEGASNLIMETKTFLQMHRFEYMNMRRVDSLIARIGAFEKMMNEKFTPENICDDNG